MATVDRRPGLTLQPSSREFFRAPGYDQRMADQEERHQKALQDERDARQQKWCRAHDLKNGAFRSTPLPQSKKST